MEIWSWRRRLYGECALPGERAAVWMDGKPLTIADVADTLAQYHPELAGLD